MSIKLGVLNMCFRIRFSGEICESERCYSVGMPTSFMVIKQSHTHFRGYLGSAECSYGDWTREPFHERFRKALITLQEKASQN